MAWKSGIFVAFGLVMGAQVALAAVSPEEAGRLDADLTPMGAERAGNQAGTIPAWDGGLNGPPPGISFTSGGHYPDPYAADQPLYTITAANMAQYDAQLTDTHKELLRAYPGSYAMKVYPSHRSCAYPPRIYEALKRNALTGETANEGNGVIGATMAPPFPIPHSAREILWNHELRYQGFKVTRESASAAPTKNGDFTPEVQQDQWIYRYADPALAKIEDLDNVFMHYMRHGISPSSNAGTMTVMHNSVDFVKDKRRGWFYKPGERKVKRVIGAEYDALIPASEGIRTNDSYNILNGGGALYDFEALGKQEKLIAYNTYHLASHELQYKDVLHKHHLNPEVMRYELHRIWGIEGKLKPGKQHILGARRRMYFDEDSWAGVAAEMYDSAGKLTRVQEAHIFNYYDQPLCNIASDVVYDIEGGRYHIVGLRNEQKPVRFDIQDTPEAFSAEGVRRQGVR
jgi:hypothetical protein